MSNVSTKQFVPMNTDYAQLNQSAVPMNNPRELTSSTDSANKFLKDSHPAPKENNVSVNKESLEKLFAMFEFAVKAMRSMLAGMGGLPKLPGELDAQPPLKPGADSKVVADTGVSDKGTPETDAKTKTKPGPDAKVTTNTSVPSKLVPEADTKAKTKPEQDSKATTQTSVPPKLVTEGDAKAKTKPEQDSKATTQTSVLPKLVTEGDAKANTKPGQDSKAATTTSVPLTLLPSSKPELSPLTRVEQNNKQSSEINLTVQVQGCHCPHTGEKVAPQPLVTTNVDKQP